MKALTSPSQTAGPFVSLGTAWSADGAMVGPGETGTITLSGFVIDGAGEPVTDGLLEFWQADGQGRFGPAGGAAWTGFSRALTGADGAYRLVTVKPGAVPLEDGRPQAPHINVSIFARGLLQRLVTRVYFSDEEANAADPVLALLAPDLRTRMVAVHEPGTVGYRLDLHLQGPQESVFFAPA